VVNAGSILEDDDQRGLAHVVEHMAFDGTAHFKKQELVNYLESVGMRFGPDLNAYTSFDETVYMLQIPTDTPSIVEKSFEILEDWAHAISFDDDQIDKERNVVIEEWRIGRGAGARMRDKQFPLLFKNSRYAERLPIGEKSILDNFRHETLRRFYRTWYRPDLMAVIAVGDFDRTRIEELIRRHFSNVELPHRPEIRRFYPVPDHDETLFAIATDSEATLSTVGINYLKEVEAETTEAAYRRSIVEALYNGMLNERLAELTKRGDPPFLFASSSKGNLVRTKGAYSIEVGVKDNGILRGIGAALTEAQRVRLFGFTQPELDRRKKEFRRIIEQAYNERDKTESDNFAAELIRHYLEREPIPGIAYEFELYKKYLPTVTLPEVNRLAAQWMSDRNRVILVNAPRKAGTITPAPEEIRAAFDSVARKQLRPYIDTLSTSALLSAEPAAGTVVEEKELSAIGVTEWRLSNGVKVIMKPTDFKNDEILFTAYSPGGSSLVPDSEYIPAITAASVVEEGGLDGYDAITLQKMLAGKLVSVSPYIAELEEGFSGSGTPQDLETMFQLIYLYVTAPRTDSTAFLAYKSRIKGYLENRSSRPESAFEDTIEVTLSQYHPRRQPWTEKLFEKLNLGSSFAVYRDRFADVGDFTFLFVGAFKPGGIRPLVLRYLASLPSIHRNEHWRDVGVRPPKGVIEKSVRKGIEPKSRVQLIFNGPFVWSRENRYALNSLTNALSITLREILREEKGGTYGVSVNGSVSHDPISQYSITIGFGCAPERVQELVRSALAEIERSKRTGFDEKTVLKVKETQRRERETSLKQNNFWLQNLKFYYQNGEDPASILRYDSLVERLTSSMLGRAARDFFNRDNYVKVVLDPRE